MIQSELRVGIVGADYKASWAKVSHVPAAKGLHGPRLAAVATRNEQSAREAVAAFGAERWFSDPFAMIRDERIGIVTIADKVPGHGELDLAALDACHAAIGLQARLNQSVRRAVQLISSSKIGRPLNARVFLTTSGFGQPPGGRIPSPSIV